jgi:hypothetical protein
MAPTNATLKASLEAIVAAATKYSKGMLEGGAHYVYPYENAFAANGIACRNCQFFNSTDNTCGIVDGYVYDYGACRFWIISDSLLTSTVTPTVYVVQQTTGFDMNSMMNMIMMIMMMSVMMSMMAPLMGGSGERTQYLPAGRG